MHLSKETVQVKSQLYSVLNAAKLASLHILFQRGEKLPAAVERSWQRRSLGEAGRVTHSASRPDWL